MKSRNWIEQGKKKMQSKSDVDELYLTRRTIYKANTNLNNKADHIFKTARVMKRM